MGSQWGGVRVTGSSTSLIACTYSIKNINVFLDRSIMANLAIRIFVMRIIPNKTVNQGNRIYNRSHYFIHQIIFIFRTSEISSKLIHGFTNTSPCHWGYYKIINTRYLRQLNKKFMYSGYSKAP